MDEAIVIAFSFEMLYSSYVYSASLVFDGIGAIKNPIVVEQTMQGTIPLDRPPLPEPALTSTHHPSINDMTTTSTSRFSSRIVFDSGDTIFPVNEVDAFLSSEVESLTLNEPALIATRHSNISEMTTTSSLSFSSPVVFESDNTMSPQSMK